MPLIPQSIADLVEADGVAREAIADDRTVHMLYRDGTIVRSVLLADWPAAQIELAAHDQERADAAALRQRVRTLAQSAVGVAIDQLTAGQVRALFAILLYREGALDKNGIVRPLIEWVRD